MSTKKQYMLVYYAAAQSTFQPQPSNIFPENVSYVFSKEAFLIFQKMELSYIFFYFGKMELLYFRKWNFLASSLKNFRRELSKLKEYKKINLKNFLIFQEIELFSTKLRKNYYISGWNLQSLKKQKVPPTFQNDC